MKNRLHEAKRNKRDEFYTELPDIEEELRHYENHFKDKVVLSNCDDPTVSNFSKYFVMKFRQLGLKEFIATCYKNNQFDAFSQHDKEEAVCFTYKEFKKENGIYKETKVEPLKGDGDFRSEECIEIEKRADIVCTNPMFSLWREYIAQLIKHKKKFLIMGSVLAASLKEVFPLIREGKIWVGYNYNKVMEFRIPSNYEKWHRIDENGIKYGKVPLMCWYTNLKHKKRNDKFIFTKKYRGNKEYYPKYDNYDAIDVSEVSDIPEDYNGAMGVPITFLGKHNPDQFEIVNADDYRTNPNTPAKNHGLIKDKDGTINGGTITKAPRILIRRK